MTRCETGVLASVAQTSARSSREAHLHEAVVEVDEHDVVVAVGDAWSKVIGRISPV